MVFLMIVLVVLYIYLEELSRGGLFSGAAVPRHKRRNRKK